MVGNHVAFASGFVSVSSTFGSDPQIADSENRRNSNGRRERERERERRDKVFILPKKNNLMEDDKDDNNSKYAYA